MTDRIDEISTDDASALVRWLPLAVLPLGLVLIRTFMPAFALMWLLVVAIFVGAKWAMWFPLRRRGLRWRRWAFLFASTAMNAEEFILGAAPTRPTAFNWLTALTKMTCGAAMIWLPARFAVSPAIAIWVQTFGLVLLVHFGFFELLAIIWQSRGIPATPLMRRPLLARSLADFWGRRWNTSFTYLAQHFIFRPLRTALTPVGATAVVFIVSGLIHELIISLPAQGGFGLPTLYFLIQLAGLLLERSRAMRPALRNPLAGWFYTMCFVLLPVLLLAHPPFMRHVIKPFFDAIGGYLP